MAITDNLIGYWKANEAAGAGTFADETTNNYDGTVTNATQGGAGIIGNSIAFDGSGDYVSCGDVTNIDSTDSFSVSFWAKGSGAGGVKQVIGKIAGYGHTAPGWTIFMTTYLYLEITPGAAWPTNHLQTQAIGATIEAGWHHYVVTYDGSKSTAGVKIYKDSVSKALTDDSNTLGAGTIQNTRPLDIGGNSIASSAWFNGSIDELALWKGKVLSQAEVDTLYNSGSGYELVLTTPTNMQINIGDAWKTCTAGGVQINIGDAWKAVAGMKVNIGDAWKTIF